MHKKIDRKKERDKEMNNWKRRSLLVLDSWFYVGCTLRITHAAYVFIRFTIHK